MINNEQPFSEPITSRAIKAHSREQMYKAVPSFWKITLVSLLLTGIIPSAVDTIFPTESAHGGISAVGLFLSILMTLFTWLINLGYAWWALDCSDGRQREAAPGLRTLFNGFSMVSQVILLNVKIYIFTLFWFMLAILPATAVISYVYLSETLSVSSILTCILLAVAVIVFCYSITLRYALAPYLLIQQGDRSDTSQAIRDSVMLMRGWKWKLFKLQLSFIGWQLLILLLQIVAAAILAVVGVISFSSLFAMAGAGNITAAISAILSVPVVGLVMELLPLPLDLWLTPYFTISTARFFRLRHQLASCPPPPVLESDSQSSDF